MRGARGRVFFHDREPIVVAIESRVRALPGRYKAHFFLFRSNLRGGLPDRLNSHLVLGALIDTEYGGEGFGRFVEKVRRFC